MYSRVSSLYQCSYILHRYYVFWTSLLPLKTQTKVCRFHREDQNEHIVNWQTNLPYPIKEMAFVRSWMVVRVTSLTQLTLQSAIISQGIAARFARRQASSEQTAIYVRAFTVLGNIANCLLEEEDMAFVAKPNYRQLYCNSLSSGTIFTSHFVQNLFDVGLFVGFCFQRR